MNRSTPFTILVLIVVLLTSCGVPKATFGSMATASTPNQADSDKIKAEAYASAKADLEAKAQADAKAKTDADAAAQAQKDAAAKAQQEAEAKAKKDAEDKAKSDAEGKQKADGQKIADWETSKTNLLTQHPEVSDVGVVDKFIVEVNKKIESTDIVGSQIYIQRAKGIYRFLYVGVLNSDKSARTIDSSMFKLVSSDGTSYDPDPTAAIYANVDNKFFLEKINPGTEAHGYIVFDMPPEVKFRNLVLRVHSGLNHADLKFVNPDPESKK